MPYPKTRLRGAGRHVQLIEQWVEFEVALSPRHRVTVIAAVVADLPFPVLFGMPFLYSLEAKHDYVRHRLETPKGNYELQPQSLHLPVAMTLVPHASQAVAEDTNLTTDEQQEVQMLLTQFEDLWKGGRRGSTTIAAHEIVLTTTRPIVSRPRTFTDAEDKVAEAEVRKMLADNVIRPSNSPYSSEVVIVLKKTGEWRFCIDFRLLNQVTIPDKYPLPRISELLRALKGSKYFAALDLRSGYWQVPMAEDSVKYTAFRCTLGLFECVMMPFGLTNAPATFQRMMDSLLGDLRFKGVLVYLDDILIHAPSFQSAKSLLHTVLARLRAANLTLNLPKSVFFPHRLEYLGQIIEDGNLIPDPKRVAALDKTATPQTVRDVRSLLGFLGYYHTYIPEYASTVEPIVAILRGHPNKAKLNSVAKIEWTPLCQKALQDAVSKLQGSVLTIPLEGEHFLIETDASDTTVAGALSVLRDGKPYPVEFTSKTLSNTQRRWPVREKEAYAIIHAVQKFDCYVRGRPTTVHTDHESLKWMLTSTKGKISRWVVLLAEYPLTIYHKKGSQLTHVDFLTRGLRDDSELAEDRMCFVLMPDRFPTIDQILRAQQELPVAPTGGFTVKDGCTYYHGRIFVPVTLRHAVIKSCHSTPPFNHPGVKRTKRILQRMFNWPNLHMDVVRHLQSCLACRRARCGEEKLQGLQRIHPVPGVLETLYLDFWQVTYDKELYTVLTMIDQFSKWAECVIIPDRTAATIASTILNHWIYRFGVPKVIVSDQDKSFNNRLLNKIYVHLGATKLTSAPYHPQGNAVIEAFHRTLNEGLRYIVQAKVPFHEALNLVLYAYRSTPHSLTHQSPGYALYGTDLSPPLDNDWRFERDQTHAERLKFLSALRTEIQLRIQQILKARLDKKNETRLADKFEVGQLVLCRLQPLDRLRHIASLYKAVPRWTMPYRVTAVNSPPTTATVTCLFTKTKRLVHLTDVRRVLPPIDEQQKEEWEAAIRTEFPTFFNEEFAPEVVRQFFESLEDPSREIASTITHRRPCKRARPTATSLEGGRDGDFKSS